MTRKDNGVAARFKQLEQCSGMLIVHCVCHRLALACGYTGDDLKFISGFETTMIYLWTSQTSQNVYKNSNEVKKNLKISLEHNRGLFCRR